MKNYHIKYLVREIGKYRKIYKRFKKESIIMFRYDAKNNKLILQFDSDYPLITVDYTNETIRHFNRMVMMVIDELKSFYHINHLHHFDRGNVCTFTIVW
jgi:ABC-type antimicrobial peptide transport system permease subunit